MARRGFFAELEHQTQVASRERERAQRVALQTHNAALRAAEREQRAAKFAQRQLICATEAEHKKLEKEAQEAHITAAEAETEERNRELADVYRGVDSLLAATLKVDNYIDLKTLHVDAGHPPFNHPELEEPIPPPNVIPDPPQPTLVSPEAPKGLASLFGRKKYAEAVEKSEQNNEEELSDWRVKCEASRTHFRAALTAHAHAENARVAALGVARAKYTEECAVRDAKTAERNRHLDELITNLSYGTGDAVQEYVSIVLSNSVYPEPFQLKHELQFDPSSAELTIRVLVPKPESIPTIKAYKYAKATDEIIAMPLSSKACRDRYESAVDQIALRTLHEIFDSDRRGLIKTIRLEEGTEAIDPATGRSTYVPLVVVGAEREAFLEFHLAAVIPKLTLERLGASLSKNPYGLVAAETSGVRRT